MRAFAPAGSRLVLTHDFRRPPGRSKRRIHMQTQIINMRRADNTRGLESPHYCRTEKRIPDHG